ncbi:MAG: dephospho-CoA kinase [Chloroflexi bacterium]|nr:dephospho-CoA kinase [Chloroflexota bacterium]
MFVIGLTGGIGTGKTQVSKILQELGATVINADLLGHEVYRPHTEGWQEVVESFGEGVLAPGGEVDRRKLGAIVFSDAEALKRLNAITHPRIFRLAQERLAEIERQGREVAVVEAALLIEANWTSIADEVWVVISDEDAVVQRLKSRNSMDESAIRARIRSQMPQEERVSHADVIIDNSGTLEDLRGQVEKLWNRRVIARKESRL